MVNLCWIFANMRIGGNEAGDQAVKQALKIENVTQIPLGTSEIVTSLKDLIVKKMAISVEYHHEGKIL